MIPETIDETKGLSRRDRDGGQRNVRPRIGSEPDNNHRSFRTNKLCKARQRCTCVHVVQRRYRNDGIERLWFKSDMMHVTMDPLDASTLVSRTSSIENGLIYVEANNLRNARVYEFRGQHPVATPDIQHPGGAMRE